MKNFDYMEYDKLDSILNDYFESVGYDAEKVWDLHEELRQIYHKMHMGEPVDEKSAIKTIDKFVKHCRKIKDAFYYPISMQECLQKLILIGMFMFEQYDAIETAAYNAAHIFHTTIFHPGE